MSAQSASREKMVLAAEDLFRRRGYAGTSLLEIVDHCNVSRGSIYFHFPGGKEQLAVEVLAHYDERLGDLIDAAAEDAAGPGDVVEAIAARFADTLEESGYELGCPAVPTALEAAPQSPELMEACRRTFNRWQDRLQSHFERLGVDASQVEALAELTMSALEGALILARLENSPAPLTRVGAHVAAVVDAGAAHPRLVPADA